MAEKTINTVLYDIDQSSDTSDLQKATARGNIGLDVVIQFKDEASVSDLNSITDVEKGWTYKLTDSGTLNDGDLEVAENDMVFWDGNVWVQLSVGKDISVIDCDPSLGYLTSDEFDEVKKTIDNGCVCWLKQLVQTDDTDDTDDTDETDETYEIYWNLLEVTASEYKFMCLNRAKSTVELLTVSVNNDTDGHHVLTVDSIYKLPEFPPTTSGPLEGGLVYTDGGWKSFWKSVRITDTLTYSAAKDLLDRGYLPIYKKRIEDFFDSTKVHYVWFFPQSLQTTAYAEPGVIHDCLIFVGEYQSYDDVEGLDGYCPIFRYQICLPDTPGSLNVQVSVVGSYQIRYFMAGPNTYKLAKIMADNRGFNAGPSLYLSHVYRGKTYLYALDQHISPTGSVFFSNYDENNGYSKIELKPDGTCSLIEWPTKHAPGVCWLTATDATPYLRVPFFYGNYGLYPMRIDYGEYSILLNDSVGYYIDLGGGYSEYDESKVIKNIYKSYGAQSLYVKIPTNGNSIPIRLVAWDGPYAGDYGELVDSLPSDSSAAEVMTRRTGELQDFDQATLTSETPVLEISTLNFDVSIRGYHISYWYSDDDVVYEYRVEVPQDDLSNAKITCLGNGNGFGDYDRAKEILSASTDLFGRKLYIKFNISSGSVDATVTAYKHHNGCIMCKAVASMPSGSIALSAIRNVITSKPSYLGLNQFSIMSRRVAYFGTDLDSNKWTCITLPDDKNMKGSTLHVSGSHQSTPISFYISFYKSANTDPSYLYLTSIIAPTSIPNVKWRRNNGNFELYYNVPNVSSSYAYNVLLCDALDYNLSTYNATTLNGNDLPNDVNNVLGERAYDSGSQDFGSGSSPVAINRTCLGMFDNILVLNYSSTRYIRINLDYCVTNRIYTIRQLNSASTKVIIYNDHRDNVPVLVFPVDSASGSTSIASGSNTGDLTVNANHFSFIFRRFGFSASAAPTSNYVYMWT